MGIPSVQSSAQGLHYGEVWGVRELVLDTGWGWGMLMELELCFKRSIWLLSAGSVKGHDCSGEKSNCPIVIHRMIYADRHGEVNK